MSNFNKGPVIFLLSVMILMVCVGGLGLAYAMIGIGQGVPTFVLTIISIVATVSLIKNLMDKVFSYV